MKILFGHDAEVADWVASRITYVGSGVNFGACRALGVINDAGLLVGGVVYHNYFPQYRNIELSFAGEGAWLTRQIICGLLSVPFDQLDCQRITGCTPRKATSAIRFLNKFGFKREGVVWRGFGKDDAVISCLRRSHWRASKWVQPRQQRTKPREEAHGEIHTRTAASA